MIAGWRPRFHRPAAARFDQNTLFELGAGAAPVGARAEFADIPSSRLRLHGDLHPGNLLWNESGPVFVDFDDCCSGPVIQDLWMLLPGDDDGRRRALAGLPGGRL